MTTTLVICGLTCLCMILSVLFFPQLSFRKIKVDSYWLITLIGAVFLFLFKQIEWESFVSVLFSADAINPLKILVLFISMTLLSIYLDHFGFFRYLANATLRRAHTSQTKLFLYLYLTVSVLTVFSSNDIIILSFTPFICFFAQNAKINPMPYLAAEFVAANTWSMALIIGNPTNIYLATAHGVNFLEYLQVMALPTMAAGLVAFLLLYLMFRRQLQAPILGQAEDIVIKDKMRLAIGLLHLGICTIILVLSSYIGVEMWRVAFLSALSLFLCASVVSALRGEVAVGLTACLRRAPWQLIPFVLSMFVLTIALKECGFTALFAQSLGEKIPIASYGLASFFTANLINNIPMSVLFCSVMENLPAVLQVKAMYATVIASNIGAFFSPIGALAGIMWLSILKDHDLPIRYGQFLKIGLCIALPTLIVSLLALQLVL